ncbi:putative acylesterase/phospholipase RssA [Micromonospora kangleipakensis]|uniref:Putative acylesterase/phospholipase RssA n=1 Tax=Micromonospora kangleipakensis TaxID=1077942 RepID=A0A4Q8BFC5_9ACTN|nr:patatin-like phospholipase family protein [Micromonospora kangleipakensis]RZU75859.1 putative acylesterase/phospholipase RssA [Micromonospora kangleipakensis]
MNGQLLQPVPTAPGRIRTRLRPADINYLVFEGGGGKGFAYLGALDVLREHDVFDHVVGYGGASAGAITAMLLAAGYTVDEIREFMKRPGSVPGVSIDSFEDFFESSTPRLVPVVGGPYRQVTDSDEERKLISVLRKHVVLEWGMDAVMTSGLFCPVGAMLYLALKAWVGKYAKKLDDVLTENKDKRLVRLLRAQWPEYVAYLSRDMGVFSGSRARDTLDTLLGNKMRNASGIPGRHTTFRQLLAGPRGAKLLVTGTNLTTGATQIFSPDHTPDFPVADAVRISMGLPFIFKPYVIDGPARDGWPAPGTYVDGGVWNNLPFREFDDEPTEKPRAAAANQPERSHTLALRLDVVPESPPAITDIGQMLAAVGKFGVFGTGESQVTERYRLQTVELNTEGLDLIEFSPPDEVIKQSVERARTAMRDYFKLAVRDASAR